MAVTLDRAALAVALGAGVRASDDTVTLPPSVAEVLDRLLIVATSAVEGYAPDAPDEVQNEGAIRLAGFLYDSDTAQFRFVPRALHNSGAAALLAPYRTQSLLGAPEGSPSPSGGGGGVPADGSITAAKLAAAVIARLLPVGGVDGQFLSRDNGVAEWVAAPSGGGDIADGSVTLDKLAAAVVARLVPMAGIGVDDLAGAVSARLLPVGGMVGVDLLSAALLARILPTGGSSGQFLSLSGGRATWVPSPGQTANIADGSITAAKLAAALVARLLPASGGITADLLSAALAARIGVDSSARHSIESLSERVNSITVEEQDTDYVDLPESQRAFGVGWSTEGRRTQSEDNALSHSRYVFPATAGANETFSPTVDTDIVPVIYRLPASASIDGLRVVWSRNGVQQRIFPGDGEQFVQYDADDFFVTYSLRATLSDSPIKVGVRRGDVFQLQRLGTTSRLAIALADLTDALQSRILPAPTIGNKGKFTAIKNDGTSWEVVDAPAGGGGGSWVAVATNVGARTNISTVLRFMFTSTQWNAARDAKRAGNPLLWVAVINGTRSVARLDVEGANSSALLDDTFAMPMGNTAGVAELQNSTRRLDWYTDHSQFGGRSGDVLSLYRWSP